MYKHHFSILIFFVLMSIGHMLSGQKAYTNCQTAYKIDDPKDWCSPQGFFNNIDVGTSGFGGATCWTGNQNDIWLQFTATATAANIVINASGGKNTLGAFNAALYYGNCGSTINEINCIEGAGVQSMFEGGLLVGVKYFIRISGINTNQGAFELCINNYNPPVNPGQDCITGSILCDKSPFVVQSVSGAGNLKDEAANTCLGGHGQSSEMQSTWFRWTAANNGTLTFTLTPLNKPDDTDFVLFEMDNLTGCPNKKAIRCMATACKGPTGLNMESKDLEEDLGCESDEDGFIKFIEMQAGKSYALMVNNFSATGIGFNVEFGGTGEFLGPEPDFEVIPNSGLACDQAFQVVNKSANTPGMNIVSYNWVFGEGAVPEKSQDKDPGPITYSKFGEKYIILEATTDKGCVVTKAVPVFAEPCCDDLFDIKINTLNVKDVSCPDATDGSFKVEGADGNPAYEFDIDNKGLFSEAQEYTGLAAGTYQVNIQDIKGCMDSITVTIGAPDAVYPDAGADQESVLGDIVQLNGSWAPPSEDVNIVWTSVPVDTSMSCTTCPDPDVYPPGTTKYYMEITDERGCVTRDSVTVRVKIERPVFAPNTFTPNQDGKNDRFTIFTNKAAKRINVLQVYDRWGEKVYEAKDIAPNDLTKGWDGTFRSQNAMSGVYTWVANVQFIDNKAITFKGSISLLR